MAYLIYLISFLEWFTTLSIEIIAIRVFTPIIWTNSISTSIILWVILLALSYWYYVWWKFSNWKDSLFLVKRIILNLIIASSYYLFLTFIFDVSLLNILLEKLNSYFFAILISSLLLFFIPVFFASQTIPLLSEVLKWENTWEKIWKLLFYSTIWSFLGSVITSSVLFSNIGVSKSGTLNSLILAWIALILSFVYFKKLRYFHIISAFLVLLTLSILSVENLKSVLFEKSNSYQNIQVYDLWDWRRVFSLNGWYSSWINNQTKESFFSYIQEIKQKIIQEKYKNIAIIWAAWLTLPYELSIRKDIYNIDVVDVDPDLKEIAEKYFLEENLNDKVKFIPESARFFINKAIKKNKKYDNVVVDVYIWKSLPAQALTYEFFNDLTKISDSIFLNVITDRDLKSDFSKKVFNTMLEAFWSVYYKDVNVYSSLSDKTNFVISNKYFEWYKKWENDKNFKIYTDDKNSIELNWICLRWIRVFICI